MPENQKQNKQSQALDEIIKEEYVQNKDEQTASNDDKLLQKYGYKAELHRGFNAFMNFSFTFTSVAVISSITVTFGGGLGIGGPAVLVWSWIGTSFFTVLVSLSMAEICSTYPTAGSVYHWAGMLANQSLAPSLCYVTGWFNFIGNAAGDASFAYGFSSLLAALLSYNLDDGTQWPAWKVLLLCIGTSLVWAIKNCLRVDKQGWFNNLGAIYQMLSTVVIVIVILVYSRENSSSNTFVWKSFNDDTGLNNTNIPYVCLIGLLTSCYGFSGYEAGGHMAEETKNSQISAPKGIVYASIATAFTGFLYLLGLLYCCQEDIKSVTSGPSSSSIINIFIKTFGENRSGIQGLSILLIINLFFAGFSSMTVTSRIMFAIARDKGFPLSSYLSFISPSNKTPIRMIFMVFLIDSLFCCLILQSNTAFAAITSITAIGYQISYMIPIFCRLTFAQNTFKQTQFSLGRFSKIVGWLSVLWLTFTSILFIFPTIFPNYPSWSQNSASLNWTGPVTGMFLFLAFLYWWFPKYGARYQFK